MSRRWSTTTVSARRSAAGGRCSCGGRSLAGLGSGGPRALRSPRRETSSRFSAPRCGRSGRGDELARVGGRPSAPTELTETERQIADLVAAGRSNKEVAAALFVSPSTVSASLGRVYRKLGVTTRTEMAARLRSEASHG